MQTGINILLMSTLLALMLPQKTHALTDPAQSKPRLALVIGNGSYDVGPLKNATNDATLMGNTLRETGFELLNHQVYHNVTKEQLSLLILDFGDQLKTRNAVGLFYFAGHGIQFEGLNYLIPVGAKLDREEYVKIYGVPLNELTSMFNKLGNDISIMILDACRNNPFASKYRSATRGLKLQQAPSDTLIFYATRPGEVSMDGDKKNSPFTTALTKHMKTPGLRLEQVLRETIKEVKTKTYNKQIPWQEGFVLNDFYFTPPQASTQTVSTSRTLACPPGTQLIQGTCVMQEVHCPQGSVKQDGRCVLLSMVPSSQVTEQINPNAPTLLSSMPVFTYVGFALGVISHLINFSSNDSAIANPAFFATYVGYGVGVVGAGVGLWRYMNYEPASSMKSGTTQMAGVIPTPTFSVWSTSF